jgi:hypothetical protein
VKRSMRGKNSARNQAGAITRRDFARHAAGAAAAIAALPGSLPLPAIPPRPQEAAGAHPSLTPEALAEAEARATEILRRYGTKLSDEQKAEIRRLSRDAQAPLEALRRFSLQNQDEPATVLQLVRTSAVRNAPASHTAASPKPSAKGA